MQNKILLKVNFIQNIAKKNDFYLWQKQFNLIIAEDNKQLNIYIAEDNN